MYKLAAIGLLALSSFTLSAATDMFIKIDGVDGESLDAQHQRKRCTCLVLGSKQRHATHLHPRYQCYQVCG